MQFIRYRPNVVLIDKDKTPHLIKKEDNLEYVREKEIIPDYL
jgi:diaminopimelate decarboxylase